MKAEMFTGARLQRPALVWEAEGRDQALFVVRPGQPVTIGRDDTNAIAIDSTFVSKAHAVVEWRGGECVVEDLGSANGTTVNGLAIQVSEIRAGDVIEIGDQRLVVKDLAPSKAGATLAQPPDPANKTARLGVVAVVTMVAMAGLLFAVAPRGPAPAVASRVGPREIVVPERPAGAPPVGTTPEIGALVQGVLSRAAQSGVPAAEGLFDEAQTQQTTSRLFEAQALYYAAARQSPPHPLAETRVTQVTAELERAITIRQADAARATVQLRHAEAAAAWEQVLMLTDPTDPRHKDAQAARDKAKGSMPRD